MVNVEDVFVLKMEGSVKIVGHLDVCHRDVKTQQPISVEQGQYSQNRLPSYPQSDLNHASLIRYDINISIDSSNNNNNNNFNNYNDNENTNGICEIDQSSITLPPFTTMSPPTFVWSEKMSGEDFIQSINAAYDEVIRWKHNVQGREFASEQPRLFRSYGEAYSLESIAIKVAMVLPHLLLQKPYPSAKACNPC